MDETKNILGSKTFWGAIISGASAILLGVFGIDISGEEQAGLVSGIASVGAVVGLVVTIYGRWTAKSRIG